MRKILTILVMWLSSQICYAGVNSTVTIIITTQIDKPDYQSGVKSRHTIVVDFANEMIKNNCKTGVTKIGSCEIDSIRDNFRVEKDSFGTKAASFMVVGETASGVMILPNINYKYTFDLQPDGTGFITGCHDGYPSYKIEVNGKNIYEFKHKPGDLPKLLGDCDINVQQVSF